MKETACQGEKWHMQTPLVDVSFASVGREGGGRLAHVDGFALCTVCGACCMQRMKGRKKHSLTQSLQGTGVGLGQGDQAKRQATRRTMDKAGVWAWARRGSQPTQPTQPSGKRSIIASSSHTMMGEAEVFWAGCDGRISNAGCGCHGRGAS